MPYKLQLITIVCFITTILPNQRIEIVPYKLFPSTNWCLYSGSRIQIRSSTSEFSEEIISSDEREYKTELIQLYDGVLYRIVTKKVYNCKNEIQQADFMYEKAKINEIFNKNQYSTTLRPFSIDVYNLNIPKTFNRNVRQIKGIPEPTRYIRIQLHANDFALSDKIFTELKDKVNDELEEKVDKVKSNENGKIIYRYIIKRYIRSMQEFNTLLKKLNYFDYDHHLIFYDINREQIKRP